MTKNQSFLSGAGNTKTHQIAISELLYFFIKKSKSVKKYSKYISLPEITLDNKIPDIVVYKFSKSNYIPVAIFEICYTNSLLKDIQKCNELMNQESTINESFVIEMTNNKFVFHKLYRLKNGNISKPIIKSKFDVLNLELSNII